MTQLTPVQSSQLHAVGYDAEAQELHVAFKSNPAKVYTYKASAEEHADLLAAESIGKHFNANFKKRPFTLKQ